MAPPEPALAGDPRTPLSLLPKRMPTKTPTPVAMSKAVIGIEHWSVKTCLAQLHKDLDVLRMTGALNDREAVVPQYQGKPHVEPTVTVGGALFP
jgi:hypothetical protein